MVCNVINITLKQAIILQSVNIKVTCCTLTLHNVTYQTHSIKIKQVIKETKL